MAANEQVTGFGEVPPTVATYDPLAAVEARDQAAMTARGVVPHDLAPGLAPTPTVAVTSEPAVEPAPPPDETSRPTQLPAEALPPPPASAPPAEPTSSASPPADAPPSPQPVETAPVQPPPPREQSPEERAAWAKYRAEEKARKDAMSELQQTRERLAAIERQQEILRIQEEQRLAAEQRAQQGYVDEPDPVQTMQQRLAQMEQNLEQQRRDMELNQQAIAFQSSGHPDYPQAYEHYVQAQIENAEATGQIAIVQERIMAIPQAAAEVYRTAMREGKTQTEVARQAAIGVIFEARKQEMLEGARRVGKTVPEMIYELAPKWGYKNGHAAEASPPAPTAAISAAEQVRQENLQAAANSLSNVTRESTPPPPRIQSRADLEAMGRTDPKALDNYIAQMDNPNRPGYDPQWLEKMA